MLRQCHYCDEQASCFCDLCDKPFCSDHGTPHTWVCGIETSACSACGGFDADDAALKPARPEEFVHLGVAK